MNSLGSSTADVCACRDLEPGEFEWILFKGVNHNFSKHGGHESYQMLTITFLRM